LSQGKALEYSMVFVIYINQSHQSYFIVTGKGVQEERKHAQFKPQEFIGKIFDQPNQL